jgi:riboflavin biosynthesis pyrimidine reductase
MPHPWAAEPCLARSSPSSRSISRRGGKGIPYELQQEPQIERMSVDVRMPIGSAPDGRLVGTALPQVQEVQRAVAHLWHHAQEIAADRVVTVAGGTIARQCLELGLLDEVAVDLVPVVMGEGNRPFFGKLSSQDVLVGNPTTCIQGDRVTHLVFPVVR